MNDTDLYEKRRKKWTKEKRERMDIATILSTIQEKLMQLWELVFDLINQKDGLNDKPHILKYMQTSLIAGKSRNR